MGIGEPTAALDNDKTVIYTDFNFSVKARTLNVHTTRPHPGRTRMSFVELLQAVFLRKMTQIKASSSHHSALICGVFAPLGTVF